MKMCNFQEMQEFIINEVVGNYDEYDDEPEKFIKTSIEEFMDDSDSVIINDAYETIIDDVNCIIVEYENKWKKWQ